MVLYTKGQIRLLLVLLGSRLGSFERGLLGSLCSLGRLHGSWFDSLGRLHGTRLGSLGRLHGNLLGSLGRRLLGNLGCLGRRLLSNRLCGHLGGRFGSLGRSLLDGRFGSLGSSLLDGRFGSLGSSLLLENKLVTAGTLPRLLGLLEGFLLNPLLQSLLDVETGPDSINVIVGTDVLGDGLAGRSPPVLQHGDGGGDHLSVGGMVDSLLGLVSVSGGHVVSLSVQRGMVQRAAVCRIYTYQRLRVLGGLLTNQRAVFCTDFPVEICHKFQILSILQFYYDLVTNQQLRNKIGHWV